MTLLSPEEFISHFLDESDDVLMHRAAYDPAKRREYYLKNRKLKGRAGNSADQTSSYRSTGSQTSKGKGTSNADMRESRRKQLEAEKKELEARLERLREVLKEAVAKAKGRSGANKPDDKEDKSTTTETKSKKDSKDSKSEPLTEKEKAEKRKAAKEQYEKEQKMSLSRDVSILREQVKDIRTKIENALEEARKRNSSNQSETA